MQKQKQRQRRLIDRKGKNGATGAAKTGDGKATSDDSVSGSPIGSAPVAPRIRQTVTSSKDLPLFQQQKAKEEKEMAKQKAAQEAARKERERRAEVEKQANMTAAEQEAYLKEKLQDMRLNKAEATNDSIDKFQVGGQLDDDFFGS